jgi:hypothetical protein
MQRREAAADVRCFDLLESFSVQEREQEIQGVLVVLQRRRGQPALVLERPEVLAR